LFNLFAYRNSLAKNREYAEKEIEFYISILYLETHNLIATLPIVFPGGGYNILHAYGLAVILSVLVLCVILPKTMHKIPYFKEFLVRDFDEDKRIR
jgi:hypothetical protein